jgi:hypothetical protein
MSQTSIDQKLDAILKKLHAMEERLGRIEHSIFHPELKPKIKDSQVTAQSKSESPQAQPKQSRKTIQEMVRLPKLYRLAARLIGAFLAFLAIVTAWVELRYDVSVASYASLDPSAPFESRFLVTNEGPFSIYNVAYFCGSAHVRVNGGREITNMTRVPIPIGELRPRATYSVRCQHWVRDAHIDPGALLEIHVFYTPQFLPWMSKQGGQQFLLKYDKMGNTIWIPTAMFSKTAKELEEETVNP